MFRGLRKKPAASPVAKPSLNDDDKMPFINTDGRENGIQAGRDYQASLEFLKSSPPSPVKRIADKLEALDNRRAAIEDEEARRNKES